MTKAERIYKDTKYACKKHIETWGFTNEGFNRLATEELVYKRTANEIKRLLDKDIKFTLLDFELGILTKEEATLEYDSIKMVELTLANQYIA